MSQRICQWIFSLWLVLASFGGGAAESMVLPSADNPAEYKIRRWTTEDGLPQNRVACMQQTRDGYLWLGTWFGLARFDGLRFTVFNKQNTSALVQDAVSALAADSEGNLWVGTRAGLVKYAGGKFSRFTIASGLPDDAIWRITAARAGGVWLQAGDKIVRGEQDHFRTVWQCPAGDTVHALQEGADGRLYIFLNEQWLRLLPERSIQTDVAGINARDWIFNAGLAASADTAFVGTSEGLRQLEFGKTNVIFAGGRNGSPANFLLRDGAGNIWSEAGTNGLQRFDGTNWQTLHLGEARSDIVCAEQDAQGNFWFGTTDGLVQLQFQNIQTFGAQEGLPDDNVWTVCQSTDGAIWAGTDHGLGLIGRNQVETFAAFTNYSAGPIHCVWPARDGGVWVATQSEGIIKIQNGQVAQRIKDLGIPSALYVDASGRLWIATVGGPVRCYQNRRLESPVAGTESLRDVRAIHQDHEGSFWFGTPNELARWHDGKLSVFGRKDGLPAGRVWSIGEDVDGTLWLGTENGLVRFAGGKFFRFTASQQMPVDAINCILEDGAGCLWLSTLHGIYRIERAQLNAVSDGKTAAVDPFIVGTADGMRSAESNGEVQPAGWKARDGRLWFPTGKGLVVIDPKLFAMKENPPRSLLESLKADGAELARTGDGRIKIAAGRGHALEFRFTACDLAAPEAVRFQMRLAGISDRWSEPMPNREADFFNLQPGDYRFEVKAMDHHGQWSPLPTMLEFSIAPCFWQTWWFYFSCATGLILLAAGVQAYRLRWQHRLLRLEQQRAVASERARIARDLHDDLGTALTGMALELDVLGREPQNGSPLVERLAKASQHTRHLAERMREVVWVVNPRCDNLRSLADFLDDQAALLLRAAGLKVRMEFPLEIPELSMDANVRHQLALSVREAFSNLVRHAHASEAYVRLELTGEWLSIVIRDNGCGFESGAHLHKEHGLINMRVRMEEIGGSFQCISAPGGGTTITFAVPRSKMKSIMQKP